MVLGNLAVGYCDLGDYEKARDIQEETLNASERILPPDDPETLLAKKNLADSYSGENLSDLVSMSNLANSYEDMGVTQTALDLRQRVAGARQRVHGWDQPETLKALSDVAVCYANANGHQRGGVHYQPANVGQVPSRNSNSGNSLGRKEETVQLREEMVETRNLTLGYQHPDTLTTMDHLVSR
ncbi:hypothetical protein AJ79_03395 [Helicocarpus griseus UAMH5409]|uniref:Kinesin light chain n=1 Tax=Helicocarpus griseus UAMH5409 TaxID=1447875 RepID=A0A2B7XZC9_9EURO|nr:hypothetical protein AJ79_03395 [Helicocarpus griseus UAMH5409]